MPGLLTINDFLSCLKNEQLLLIDSRSEGEFESGHIPGAVNIPLLNNEQRVIIGTIFKQQGRQAAIIKGFELVGPHFHELIQKTKSQATTTEVMLYCWRGGLRSNILSWLLSMSGFKVGLLQGGYKSFRRWALLQFAMQRKIVVLGGKTGSGKTEMLQMIQQLGEQVICLETLANHKGSAFGSLGQLPQPTQETFENELAFQLGEINPVKRTWLENESRNIGFIKIPDPLYEQMRNAVVVEMEVKVEIRKKRILNEYGEFPFDQLIEKTQKLQKRMGGQHVKAAIDFIRNDDQSGWVELLLIYYDKTYNHSNEQRNAEKVRSVKVDWIYPETDAKQLIKQADDL